MNIKDVPDEMIIEYPPRGSGVIDYRIGLVSVSYRGGGRWYCGTCKFPDNCQTPDRRGCAHIRRVARFREERQAELNVVKADPSCDLPIAG